MQSLRVIPIIVWSLLTLVGLPAVALAVSVQISVDGQPCDISTTIQSTTAFLDPFPQFCDLRNGDRITIDSADGIGGPRIDAAPGASGDQLILSNTVITNGDPYNGVTSSDSHKITITYSHQFSNNSNINLDRYFGLSASGSFFRPPFDLASGDSFTMTSCVTYRKNSGPVTAKIDGATDSGFSGSDCTSAAASPPLKYNVPNSGSVSLNDYTPQNPQQIIEKINCSMLKPTGQLCDTAFGEAITTILSITLSPDDSNILVGSADNVATGSLDLLVQILAGFTAKIDVKPGDSDNLIGPGDQGQLLVDLFGNAKSTMCIQTDTVKIKGVPTTTCVKTVDVPRFDVTQVDFSSVEFPVVFGPKCPTGYPATDADGCKARAKHESFIDSDGDGILDVRIQFENPEIGWNTTCPAGQKTGTLVGKLTGGTFFTATSSILCQPGK